MSYNFDEIIDRKGTNSVKYDYASKFGKPEDVIPLWVADMDFKTPPAVIDALTKAAQHGIFGYNETGADYFEAVHNWYKTRFDWSIDEDWMLKAPGVVHAVAVAIHALTSEGDAVMIQRPVYHPFANLIMANKRKLVNNPLLYKDNKYYIDFDDFEAKILDNKVKLFVLCSPHNPVGRVWTKDELVRLGDICVKHKVIVISDEIHGDFIYPGNKHHVFASLKDAFAENSIICTAPSKTFNLAGLQASNIFVPNKDIREQLRQQMVRSGYSQLNNLGLVACQAAYTHGAPWLEELIQYLAGNVAFVRSYLAEHLPQVKLVEPQGTYLLWLDFNGLGLAEDQLEDLIVNKAKLWFSNGTTFGPEGKGFERMNIACPRSVLERALRQLGEALNNSYL